MRKPFYGKVEIKHQFFTNDKSFILTGSYLAYLTAFLNSSLFKFAFKDDFPELLGETRELRKVFFENISIKQIENESWFEEKVDEIVSSKKRKLNVEFLEREINEKIFDLYQLTDSERALITGNVVTPAFSEDSINAISLSESE